MYEICSGDCLTCNACDHRMYMYVNVFLKHFCLTCNVCDVRDGDPKSDTARDKLALESLAHQILWCQKVLLSRYSDVKES